ncbi:EamA family transporter [Ancylobacter sp. A5.8]|uniref:DMT family transporter n=1 Tax=Ancylobacter gelatini TaxID=2919920 RepID=UPI001F4DDA3E|nr:EamA family transporter [Ancylobacter gelatini]MCJ8145306.1 EamA family transporter [Ancylobacter gelatini]
MRFTDKLLAIGVVACWAGNLVLVKQGVTEIPPMLMSVMRFALVAALLVPFTRIERQHLRWLALASVTFGTLHFGMLFVALSLAEVGTSTVLMQLGAPMASLMACATFGERLRPAALAGLALTIAGVLALSFGPGFPAPLPFALLLASAAGWAVTNLIIKAMPRIDPLAFTGWSALFSVPQLALLTLLFEPHGMDSLATAGPHGWGALAYSVVMSSVLAYWVWYSLLERNPVTAVVPFSMLNPVMTISMGALFFAEPVPPMKIFGTALILAGVILVLRRPLRIAAT